MVKIRRAFEALLLGLFLFFLLIADLRYLKRLAGLAVSGSDAAVAVSTGLTTHTQYRTWSGVWSSSPPR